MKNALNNSALTPPKCLVLRQRIARSRSPILPQLVLDIHAFQPYRVAHVKPLQFGD